MNAARILKLGILSIKDAPMNYVMKKDRKLKQAAKKIFGPIVKNAWIATYAFSDDSKSTQRDTIKNISCGIIDKDGTIETGAGRVAIEFTTGKKVMFWGSEWGGIKPMGKGFKDVDELNQNLNIR